RIIASCRRAGIRFFAITIAMPMNPLLRRIAEETGGAWFENVVDGERVRAIYQSIAATGQGAEPCEIRWRSNAACGPAALDRTVTATLREGGTSGSASYLAPEVARIYLQSDPTY